MGKKVACIKCGSINELNFGTCECKECHQMYGVCKKCHRRFDASGGVCAVCSDCRDKQAREDSDGTFLGNLDAKIMNSNHSLEKDLLKILIAIPILKPLKLRRKDGAAWWFGTIWLTLYLGLVFSLVLSKSLEMKDFTYAGIMGWGAAFILLILSKTFSSIGYEDGKGPFIAYCSIVVIDVIAIIIAYNIGASI